MRNNSAENLEEATMTEIENLIRLRSKLIARRRMLVTALANADVAQLSGDAISRIQNAIEAVNSAITQEKQSSPTPDPSRRGAPESAATVWCSPGSSTH
jgi:hypothetical protein